MGVSTPTQRKNYLGNFSALFLVGHWIKWAKNAHIWPKMSVLGQIWSFWGQKSIFQGDGVKLFASSYQGTNETPFPIEEN